MCGSVNFLARADIEKDIEGEIGKEVDFRVRAGKGGKEGMMTQQHEKKMPFAPLLSVHHTTLPKPVRT